MRFDLTLQRGAESGEFLFEPHSARANDFLQLEFALIGDRDLTMQDADVILRRAVRRGLLVRDLVRYGVRS